MGGTPIEPDGAIWGWPAIGIDDTLFTGLKADPCPGIDGGLGHC